MLLQLGGHEVLLPKSVVKEVVYKPHVQIFEDENDWLIGEIEWQDYVIPLISFEQLCDQPRAKKSEYVRAVICYAMERNDMFPYYAIEVQSIPRPLILGSRALHNHEDAMSRDAEVISYHVKIGSKEMSIPSFEKLESMIAKRAN